MFSPATRNPHLIHRRDKEDASPSPPPPAVPFHSPSLHGFAVPDRPATGTPAPWTSSSLLSRSRRDELLGSLYDLAKQILEEKKTESREGTDNLDLKECIFREVISPILAIAKRHEGYQTLWHICYDISDTVPLRNLMHDSVGPHGGFSFYVFKQLINSRQYAKLLRLSEEFQEELASFLKDRNDLLCLHEICLNQFFCASETLHTCVLLASPEEDVDLTSNRKPLSFVERRHLLYLCKFAATAGTE